MSRTVSFVAGVTAGVIGGVYLAQTYAEKLPNVEATVKDLLAKAQVAAADLQKLAVAAAASATAAKPVAPVSDSKPAPTTTTTTEVVYETVVEEVIEQPKADTN
ncbi:hypothetical protein BC829DRAFT_386180 [Chytridium lagenaria]|nr:hypothetical protein BC829DRAFT_386180 [Chytridium lagenaria]